MFSVREQAQKISNFLKVSRSESWNFGIILKYNSLSQLPLEELFFSISTYPMCPNSLGQLSKCAGIGGRVTGRRVKENMLLTGKGLTGFLSSLGRGRVGERTLRQLL